ncbi:HP0495 family protein [Campylobacter magnus]|uniref:HP0495 family protein n=1 Tax=Campylobacter magnus TaxID=3026462 RepID=UPI00235E9603|nr:hypothetical protein [Campylobacter magnus]MDD0856100.1 hypothetical protein [Campylobacter magnus]
MSKTAKNPAAKTAKNSAKNLAKNSADTAKTAKNLAQNLVKDLARNSRIPISTCLADIKPKIDYPLIWEYTIFVPLDRDEKELIANTLGICEHKLTASNKNTKYKSFKLNLLVRSENERLEIFAKLKAACAFVL